MVKIYHKDKRSTKKKWRDCRHSLKVFEKSFIYIELRNLT